MQRLRSISEVEEAMMIQGKFLNLMRTKSLDLQDQSGALSSKRRTRTGVQIKPRLSLLLNNSKARHLRRGTFRSEEKSVLVRHPHKWRQFWITKDVKSTCMANVGHSGFVFGSTMDFRPFDEEITNC